MNEWHLTVLAVAAIAGGAISGWKEAQMIVAGKDLNHVLLTVFRLSMALILMAPFLPRPVELPHLLMCLLMMMGCFAPAHRLILNLRRMDLGHRIPVTHLGKGWYDSLALILWRGNEGATFVSMTTFETLIAAAMYNQLTP